MAKACLPGLYPGAVSEKSTDVVLQEIEELRTASRQREAALRDIAAQLPAAVSRRAVLGAMVNDLRSVPDRRSVAKRVVAKILRTPSDLIARRKAR